MEYKFRGRDNNGYWRFGLLHYNAAKCCYQIVEFSEIPPSFHEPGGDRYNNYYDIDSSTVGMFTGLTDKNKKDIFQGDEIIMNNLAKGFVKYSNGAWLIEWYDDSYSDLLGWENWRRGKARGENTLEVVGNIHDKE